VCVHLCVQSSVLALLAVMVSVVPAPSAVRFRDHPGYHPSSTTSAWCAAHHSSLLTVLCPSLPRLPPAFCHSRLSPSSEMEEGRCAARMSAEERFERATPHAK